MSDDERELRERVYDLTRALDESPAAGSTGALEAELARVTSRLERGGTLEPQAVVEAFCAAWSRRDVDELVCFFTEDAVYHNIPIDPVQGHDGIRNMLGLFVPPASAITFEIVRIASSGPFVLTERVDRFTIGAKEVVLPVAGVFEIRDGKIAAWRDYFDMGTWTKQTS